MYSVFFSSDPSPTEIYTLSLHDALPILNCAAWVAMARSRGPDLSGRGPAGGLDDSTSRENRSEEHTSELQSHHDLVCRLLLEKKKHQCCDTWELLFARAQQCVRPPYADP